MGGGGRPRPTERIRGLWETSREAASHPRLRLGSGDLEAADAPVEMSEQHTAPYVALSLFSFQEHTTDAWPEEKGWFFFLSYRNPLMIFLCASVYVCV